MNNKLENKLMEYARSTLERNINPNTDTEYVRFLKDVSRGICPKCGCKIKVIEAKEGSYKYDCGHSWATIKVSETLSIKESLGLKAKKQNHKRPVYEMIDRHKESGDPRLIEGVREVRVIDRENNKYSQTVIDNKTGGVLHKEDESLNKHKTAN